MAGFTAHHLVVEARAETPLLLGEHPGAAIRGALFHALRGRPGRPGFCLAPDRADCRGCPHLAGCPVSFLLATVDDDARRGGDVPRPYVVDPPLDRQGPYEPGEPFRFGLTMFARAMSLFPYVVVAVRRLEAEGIGRKQPDSRGRWRPGRFRVDRIVAANPLTGEEQVVLQRGDALVAVPSVPITHDHVLAVAGALAASWPAGAPARLTVDFLTPARLVQDGRPLPRPIFRPLLQRLIERLSSLWEEYGEQDLPVDFDRLMSLAAGVRLVADDTRWLAVRGYSTRDHALKQLDGFLGRATYEGDLAPLLPWLIWGAQTHVGKDAVKGCGLYTLSPACAVHPSESRPVSPPNPVYPVHPCETCPPNGGFRSLVPPSPVDPCEFRPLARPNPVHPVYPCEFRPSSGGEH